MEITTKPKVQRIGAAWWVIVSTVEGDYLSRWRTHTAAMNCALAIARTSTYKESPCPTR